MEGTFTSNKTRNFYGFPAPSPEGRNPQTPAKLGDSSSFLEIVGAGVAFFLPSKSECAPAARRVAEEIGLLLVLESESIREDLFIGLDQAS